MLYSTRKSFALNDIREDPFSEGACCSGNKQAVTKIISLVKLAENLPSVFRPLKRQYQLQLTTFFFFIIIFLYLFFFLLLLLFYFSEKTNQDISCESSVKQSIHESSVKQTIHLKCQDLFSLKNKTWQTIYMKCRDLFSLKKK